MPVEIKPNIELLNLFDSVRDIDITDPIAMDNILAYLEDLEDEFDLFMQLLVKQTQHASITWEQPWYQKSTCLTKTFSETAGDDDEQYMTGTFIVEETERVENNWQKFRKIYDVPDKLISLARWRNKAYNRYSKEERSRVFVVAYLARGLKRTLSQVHRYIISTYGCPNRGHFTQDELKVMQICMHHKPVRAGAYLARVLGREPRGINKKLNYSMYEKAKQPRIKWTLSLATKFVQLLMEYTKLPLESLKNHDISIEVWNRLEKDFDKEKIYLRYFWSRFLHIQLFVKCKITTTNIIKKVLKVLQSSPYKIWHDIRWKEVAKKFPDGFTFDFLYQVTRRMFTNIPHFTKMPLEDILQLGFRLLSKKKSSIKSRRRRRLKTLILNDIGELEVKMYENKLEVSYFE